MQLSVKQILEFLAASNIDVTFSGDEAMPVTGFCSLNYPKSDCIMWLKKPTDHSLDICAGFSNNLVITPTIVKTPVKNCRFIVTANPKAVFFSILDKFFGTPEPTGISPKATVLTDKIGSNVYIGEGCFIGKDVEIEDNVKIYPNAVVENRVHIGHDTHIYAGAVVGTAGIGEFYDENGYPHVVPDFGGVTLGNYVNIGANAVVSRGTLDDTRIGDYTLISALSRVSHNVIVGKCVTITGSVMIAGSAVIGDYTHIGPGAAIINQIKVGKNCIIGIGATVVKDVPENSVLAAPTSIITRKLDEFASSIWRSTSKKEYFPDGDKKKLLRILKSNLPTVDFEGCDELVTGGVLDSLGIVTIITVLSEEYGIQFTVDEMVAENFDSLESISKMIDRLAAGHTIE